MMLNKAKGPIAWFLRNTVAANLLMWFFLVGGLVVTWQIKKEVFPAFSLDEITITVSYPGAAPEAISQGILLAIEEALSGVSGLSDISATAKEGTASVTAELQKSANAMSVYQDVKQAVDRITTFPDGAEQPQTALATRDHQVVDLTLYGEVSHQVLQQYASQVRRKLLANPAITKVDLSGMKDYEVEIALPLNSIERYGLGPAQVAAIIRKASVDGAGGSLYAKSGELMLKVDEEKQWATDYADISVKTLADGSVIKLHDIAEVREGFTESTDAQGYNGFPAVIIQVYRQGDESPMAVISAVQSLLPDIQTELPNGLTLKVTRDLTEVFQERLDLLLSNAFIGLVLVMIVLGLFLQWRLAIWVTMGIPTAFLGGMLLLPAMDVSINMISMFAFILALGIVVDDAIIAGENIYAYQQQGYSFFDAALLGAKSVAIPLSCSILTNIVAFSPLYFLPGFLGKIFQVTPLVIAAVFIVSWVEALFILPAHLAAIKSSENSNPNLLQKIQMRVDSALNYFIHGIYEQILRRCLHYRYLSLLLFICVSGLVMSYCASGRMGFSLMPRVQSDYLLTTAIVPVGASADFIEVVEQQLVEGAKQVKQTNDVISGISTKVEDNTIEVRLMLMAGLQVKTDLQQLSQQWRSFVGIIPGLEQLKFEADAGGPGRGAALTVELSHQDQQVLEQAAQQLAAELAGYAQVKDVNDGVLRGKEQLRFKLLPAGESLGLTPEMVAQQVRAAFYGAEALRQLRGEDEVKVMVRLPRATRESISTLNQLKLLTPAGHFVPLNQVVSVSKDRSYQQITRNNGQQVLQVSANIEPISHTQQLLSTLQQDVFPILKQHYPSLSISLRGKQETTQDSISSLITSSIIVLIVLYAMLAIPFNSYSQPLLVLVAIPFGLMGAVIGHIIMGESLSMISIQGMVALSGVVVNDSLVLIDYANKLNQEAVNKYEIIIAAAKRRFRPIMMTTLTTFVGLAPMMFETAAQAKFLVPMAISLGYGVLFATAICLLLLPCMYVILDDVKRLLGRSHRHESAIPA
ncbi:efflux RND transporter permease subunit [Zooshikella harenae]|uniref:Efflux RND transporter permease subunit n=1 Tax=Zooshikella harenae TaxID=2827238 RepID=A0ABS5Z7T5_9GAMM|nr:efflux RND transporter permease subunit [Zooshikella harenae]MBU2710109.1 efflux RND transporter permease subunit [Zooshikella harenae]